MSILFISLICISSVAGTDSITENANSDFLETSDGNSLISVGTCEGDGLKSELRSDEKQDVNGNESELNSFKDLDSQIQSSLSEVNLTQNYLFDDEVDSDFVGGIKITNNDLVIDGLNHVIDANGKARIFNISSNNVTLKNIKFINAFADRGGALYIRGEDAKIINCTFINDIAHIEAGSIYLRAPRGQISNSIFINSSANYTGAVLMNSANASVVGSYFENNRANISAGALGWASKDNGIIKDCIFTNNAAYNEGGGALFWNRGKNGILQNNTFVNNYANYYGGAIFWSHGANGQITGSIFINNTASDDGGAIYSKGINNVISDCIFSKNAAGAKGGAISTLNSLNIFNSVFDNNSAEDFGGAIYYGCELFENIISNSNFTNTCADLGSCIYVEGECDNSNFTQLKFINNRGEYGIGIYMMGEIYSSLFAKIDFVNNTATDSAGAFFFRNMVQNSTFDEINLMNNSAKYGGAVSLNGQVLSNTFTRITGKNNHAGYDGGVFLIINPVEGNLFNEMEFINNSAGGNGGVFYSHLIFLRNEITNVNFENNNADQLGGVFYFRSDNGENRFINCTFAGNGAVNGSATFSVGNSMYNLFENIDFTGNVAQDCGILYYNFKSTDEFISSKFIGNTINNKAVLYFNSLSSASFDGCEFADNAAGDVSDIYYGDEAITSIENSLFNDKNAIYVALNSNINFINNVEKISYPGSYFVLNNGLIFLANNSLCNPIVNRGEIYSKTAVYILNNETIIISSPNANLSAYCVDDNGNYIVGDNLTFDVGGDKLTVAMDYNKTVVAGYELIEEGIYVINATLSGELSDCVYYIGIINFDSRKNPNLNVSDITITPDENAEILIQLANNAAGFVNVSLEGHTYGASVNNGTALIILPKMDSGNYSADISYMGDDVYQSRTAKINIVVKTVLLDAHDMTRGWNSDYDYQVKLTDDNGNAIEGKLIEFAIGGKQYYAKTNGDGFADLNTKLAVGIYNVTVLSSFGPNVTKTLKIVKRIQNNKNLKVFYESNRKYKVKIIGDDGKAEGKSKSVTVVIDNKKHTYKTDKNGFITITLNKNFKPGAHSVKIQYKGFSVQNKIVVKHTLKSKKVVTVKKSAKKVTLQAKLSKKVKNKIIKFKIKNKTYKAKTNKKGIAKVVIKNNFKKGTYAVKITYLKDVLATKLKVK